MPGTVVVLFTDIVGSTELSARLGDDVFDGLRRAHFDVLDREVQAHTGTVVKNMGDGVLAAFGAASDAVSAAVAMQRAVAASARGREHALHIRIGISAGDATFEDGDWFGTPVNEAARLCAAAAQQQILVSEVVRLLAGTRGGHEFAPVGALELKGLPDPVVTSEVRWVPVDGPADVPFPAPLGAAEGELPFAGRADALTGLLDDWRRVRVEGQRAVLVAGEPGVGKTRLVAELARVARTEGATVVLGRVSEYGDVAYAPWREALRPLVRHLPEAILAAHVAEHGGELARVLPELARRVPDLPAPIAADPETERGLLFEAVGGLLDVAAADGPLLVVLDDLHWADRSSLVLLLERLRGRSAAPVLVVATYRDTDVDRAHALAAVLADLRREPVVTRIALGGLDEAGVADLLAGAGGHDLDAAAVEFARVLQRDTNGNPFFVGEVLRHLVETGGLVQRAGRWVAGSTLDVAGLPDGVREVLGRRLAELPEETNRVLGVAAVLGQEFDVGLAATVGEMDPGDVLDALDPAVRAQLLREVSSAPGFYVFAHALVRAVLVEELGTNRRVRLHRAAGLALEARPEPALTRLAYHFSEAAVMGETDRAVRYAVAAAEEALASAAAADAAALVDRAVELAELGGWSVEERLPLRILLGRALNAAADVASGCAVLRSAFDDALVVGAVEHACTAALEYAGATVFEAFGDPTGPAQLRAVLELLPPGDSEPRVEVVLRLSMWMVTAPGTAAADTAREAYDMAGRLGADRHRALAASVWGLAERSGDPHVIIGLADEALTLLPPDDRAYDAVYHPMFLRAEARLALGDRAAADADWRTGVELMPAPLAALFGFNGLLWEQTAAGLAGDFPRMEACADQLDDWPGQQRVPRFSAAVGRMLAAYLMGDWIRAGEMAQHCYDTEPMMMAPYPSNLTVFTTGYEGARTALTTFVEDVAPLLPAWTCTGQAVNLPMLARWVGAVDVAERVAAEFAGLSGRWWVNSILWCGGPFDIGLGTCAVVTGDLDAAVERFAGAVATADAFPSPSWGVIARLELATALALRAGRDDARRSSSANTEARTTAVQLGMRGWVERLDALAAGYLEPWRIGIPG